jgi:hypothetical protein
MTTRGEASSFAYLVLATARPVCRTIVRSLSTGALAGAPHVKQPPGLCAAESMLGEEPTLFFSYPKLSPPGSVAEKPTPHARTTNEVSD